MMLCLATMAASAQGDDFGIWTSVEVQKKIDKKWNVSAEAEMRMRDNVKTVDRWSGGLDVSYKIAKDLKISAGYIFLWDNNDRISRYDGNDSEIVSGATWDDGTPVRIGDPKKRGEYWGARHRFHLSLAAEKTFGAFNVSLRERWQYTYRPEHTVDQRWSFYDNDWDDKEHTYRAKGKNVLRSRLQVEYKQRKGQKLLPYASVEMYNAWAVEKMRYTLGADYKIAKKHTLGLYYRYQSIHDESDDEPNRHVLGVGYKFKF